MFYDSIEKGAISGISTGLLSAFALSNTPLVMMPIINRPVPVWIFGALVGFGSSVATDSIHSLVKSEVHLREKALDEASMIIGALVGAGSFMGILALLSPQYVAEFGLYNALGVGASGDLIGSFLFHQIRG